MLLIFPLAGQFTAKRSIRGTAASLIVRRRFVLQSKRLPSRLWLEQFLKVAFKTFEIRTNNLEPIAPLVKIFGIKVEFGDLLSFSISITTGTWSGLVGSKGTSFFRGCAMAVKEKTSELVIQKLTVGRASVWIKGKSPFIYNSMSGKVLEGLLFPKGKKTKADKEQTIKHEPFQEYQDSVYQYQANHRGKTRLYIPSTMIKAAMCNAALEIPGTSKAQMGRLIWVESDTIDMYGIPQIFCQVVRSADMNRTPDVRTRAILPEWCCKVTINFTVPTINEVTLGRLLETAGLLMGIGDFRQQKGKGSYGQFSTADEDECEEIVKASSKAAQDDALENPTYYDLETKDLLEWFKQERKSRGK